MNKELADFMNKFEEMNNIKTEPLYTAKMFYGLNDLIQNKFFPDNSRIIAVHTGGLQGIPGMMTKMNKLQQNQDP